MPVNFYPPKPIELLENYIVDGEGKPLYGEIEVYKTLFQDLGRSKLDWHVWHNYILPFHSDSYNYYRKTNCQIDFIILCQKGIIVLEVKGGPISFKGGTFFYGNNFEKEMSQNPFHQVQGYKFTLIDKLFEPDFRPFISHGVAFPHSSITSNLSTIDENEIWDRSYKSKKSSIETFLLNLIENKLAAHERKGRRFSNLSPETIQDCIRILNPLINDVNEYYNFNTNLWLQVENLNLLESLSKNERIMIEGGPGTGKTTLAKAFIDKQLAKRGFYLCWNNLLMNKVKHDLRKRGLLKTCDVYTYLRFLKTLFPGIKNEDLLKGNSSDLERLVDNEISKSSIPSQKYDYAIFDEGQDYFDKGLGSLMEYVIKSKTRNHELGRCLVLYDIDQSFFLNTNYVREKADSFLIDFAHFSLSHNQRSSQNPSIWNLAKKIRSGKMKIESLLDWNDGVTILSFQSLLAIKNYIVKRVLSQIRNPHSSLRGDDCVLLIQSNLLKPKVHNEPGMHFYLEIKDVIKLDENNIGDSSNKLWYSSILKFKGLEKNTVVLVLSGREKIDEYEAYVGITRAISQLIILILK